MTPGYDLAVVGLGAVGSMALWRAAARGVHVIGLEQYGIAHARGSSHGGSRIFRRTLFEGDDYIPLVNHAAGLWADLATETHHDLLTPSGNLCIGPKGSDLIRRALRSAEAGGFAYTLLEPDTLAAQYPQHATVPGDVAVLEPGAGVLNPEQCIVTAVRRARELGAETALRTPVTGIYPDTDGIRLRVANDVIEARSVILATGAWLTRLIPDLGLSVLIQRSPLVWFTPRTDRAAYGPHRFPCFVRKTGDLDGWGIPDIDRRGVKVGAGPSAPKPYLGGAEDNDRPIDSVDTGPPEAYVARALPGLNPVAAAAEPCMNARTPDRDFILGAPAGLSNVVLAGGFSGHGFKHAPASADVAVDLALHGESPLGELPGFRPDRLR